MRNKSIQFPHPLLTKDGKDILNSSIDFIFRGYDDSEEDIKVKVELNLHCLGMEKLLELGQLKALVRVTCYKTSHREALPIAINSSSEISLDKNLFAEKINLEPWIVAADNVATYKLTEFNKNYFDKVTFKLNKGNILATAEGFDIILDKGITSNMSGIVNIAKGDKFHVHYAKNDDIDPSINGLITIYLPDKEFDCYKQLRDNKFKKCGVESYLLSSLVMPVIAEAISISQDEDYNDTEWAKVITDALNKHNINLEDEPEESSIELANMIFDDVIGKSLWELHDKMDELNKLPFDMEDE